MLQLNYIRSYEIEEENIKGVYVFEDNQVTYYDTSYETTTNTETTISSEQFKADYVGKNVYSAGGNVQSFFDSFDGTDTAEKISEEMLTDIIKKHTSRFFKFRYHQKHRFYWTNLSITLFKITKNHFNKTKNRQ